MAVREGRAGDAEAIAAVHGRAWFHAYDDFLPYEQLTKYDQDERRAWWAQVLRGDHDSRVLVATTGDDTVRAFAAYGAARDEDRPGEGELYAMYVDPAAQGAGLGTALLDAVTARMREDGYGRAILWVYEENGHGRAFYAGRGWEPDGTRRLLEDWGSPGVRYGTVL